MSKSETDDKPSKKSIFKNKKILIPTIGFVTVLLVLLLQSILNKFNLFSFSMYLNPMATAAIFVSAFLCEYIDSSLGMGYGTTLTPVLLLVGFEPIQVVPCVLLSELITGISATLMHQSEGNVDFIHDEQAKTTGIMLSLLSAVGALAAVFLSIQIPKMYLKGIIGIIILSAGIMTLATIRKKLKYRKGHLITIGAIAAFNKGLSGGGYGPLVTSGQVVSGLSTKKAVAITSLAESFTCLIGLISYLLLYKSIEWKLALPLSLGAILSVPFATLTVKGLSERTMKICVGVVTCLLGLFTLIKLVI